MEGWRDGGRREGVMGDEGMEVVVWFLATSWLQRWIGEFIRIRVIFVWAEELSEWALRALGRRDWLFWPPDFGAWPRGPTGRASTGWNGCNDKGANRKVAFGRSPE
jgi:hypothetical protein